MDHNNYKCIETIKEKVWSRAKDKPSRFEQVVLKFSEAKTYELAIQEWDSSIASDMSTSTCICSQEIEDLHYITNRVTGNILIVGSECINKLGTEEMKKDLKTRSTVKNYTGEKRPCLHCGTHKKSEGKFYCSSCLSNQTNTPSRVVLEEIGLAPCWGLDCDAMIPNIISVNYCDKCDAPESLYCYSCGDWSSDKPRCFDCYKKKMPIKCKSKTCLTMIPYAATTSWKTMCDICKSKQPRVCSNGNCSNIIASTAPSNYHYCSWSCRQNR